MHIGRQHLTSILAVSVWAVAVSPALAGQAIYGAPLWWGDTQDSMVVPGDFDQDGDIDLLSAATPRVDSFGQPIAPGKFTMNFNVDGLGTFSQQELSTRWKLYAILVVDVNGDGARDIIDGALGVQLGNGDGTFGNVVVYSNGSSVDPLVRPAAGDMDGDGDIDIVVPNDGPVLLNNGSGAFSTNFVSSEVVDGEVVTVGDINEDGHLDIAMLRNGRETVTIQLGIGQGQGNPGPPYTVSIAGDDPIDLKLLDMNGDNHLDLVTLNQGTDDVTVTLGAGDGTFGSSTTYTPHDATYFGVNHFSIADVNGDGAPDVVVNSTDYDGSSSPEETGILLNDGNGALALEQIIPYFGRTFDEIAAADFDNDGNTDLITATQLLINQMPATIGMAIAPRENLLATGPAGGPFEPTSAVYTLTNNGDSPMEYSVTDDAEWLSVSNGTGTIPAGGEVEVVLSFNDAAEALANGDYDATVSFVNLTNHHGDRTRDVKLEVGVPQVVYSFPLDTDPGWVTEGDWGFGQPTGQGGAHGSPDPTSGFTGPNVYGYNLNGDYPGNLWYRNLTSTAIDCSNLSHVTVRYRRWLGVRDQPDDVSFRMSYDGDFFIPMWLSDSAIYDSDWQLVEHDISPFADGKSTVYLQWTMGPTYSGGACGWNIDDIEILAVEVGATQRGDLDRDGDVDMDDFSMFSACMAGPDRTDSPSGCDPDAFEAADLDGDGDADLCDFGALQSRYE